jgi:hypothetical protein
VAGAPSETGSLLVVEKRQGPYTGEKEKVLELDALMEEEGGDFYLFHKHKKILRITSAI